MQMNYKKGIVVERVGLFRAMARDGLRGRASGALLLGFVYGLALNLPSALLNLFSGLELMRTRLMEEVENTINLGADPTGGALSRMDAQLIELSRLMTDYTTLGNLLSLLILLIAGPLALGFAICCLRLRRGQPCGIGTLFSGFERFWRAVGLIFLQYLFIALWSMLLIVPGIIALYRYRFAFFILADNPDIGPLEAIRASKFLTGGNKGKMFLLDLSFIGWYLLMAVLVSALGAAVTNLFYSGMLLQAELTMTTLIVTPVAGMLGGVIAVYVQTAQAAFYEHASGLAHPVAPLSPPPF
jgi:uncharacterized membrane protein